MYGYWYSVKENYSFTSQELKELAWTAIAFALCLTVYYENLFVLEGDVRMIITDSFLAFLVFSSIISFLSLYGHVALQKLIGIRLGYKVKYSYWMNGILLGLFLCIATLGKIPVLSMFILPGAVTIEHIPKLRLGKFRFGVNTKDIARVSLMGPLSHVLIITFLGLIFFALDKNAIVFRLIVLNVLMMLYSILPIPRIDSILKMDGATDGLGIFYYARWVYILCGLTFLAYALMIIISTTFSFVLAFLIAAVAMGVYYITMKQPN